jgi:mRNA interferase RelE/StbE
MIGIQISLLDAYRFAVATESSSPPRSLFGSLTRQVHAVHRATTTNRCRTGAGRVCLSGGTCRDDAATPVEVSGEAAGGLYVLRTTPTARRALSETLPEAVAVAAYEFMTGPLLADPHRVGKRLLPPFDDRLTARRGTYRIIYRVDDRARVVTVVDVAHHRDVYRT